MPRDKTDSHIRIIQAATEEFLEKGFQNASTRSIAARAGITSGGLYRHFKDKEEMFKIFDKENSINVFFFIKF